MRACLMAYTAPSVTDLGSIAEHTFEYFVGGSGIEICKLYPEQCATN